MLWLKDTQSKNSIMYNFEHELGPKVCSTARTLSDVLGRQEKLAKKEAKLTFLHEIVNNEEKFQILSLSVLNLDQTILKYVSMGKIVMTEKGSNSVPISSLSDKKQMTETFTTTVNRKFFPMQLIYGGKTNQSLPKFEFPLDFSCRLILNTAVIQQSP